MVAAYLQPSDLLSATTQYFGSTLGTQGVDFTLYTPQQLQSLITRASAQIDGYCKQTFALTNVQERYTGRGTNSLRLRKYPLAQITDAVIGATLGNLSQSLVVDTTTTTNNAIGDTAVHVADCSNALPGQFLQWGDSSGEGGIEITASSATSGAGTLTLKSGLTLAHTSGARVAVNTIDFMQIVLPGQTSWAIPTTQLVVDAEQGSLLNYSPLMYQQLGYGTIFPKALPLLTRYTYGFLSGKTSDVLREVCLEQCRRMVLFSAQMNGVQSVRSGDASVSYAAWKPVPFEDDLQAMLGPFRRDIGFH